MEKEDEEAILIQMGSVSFLVVFEWWKFRKSPFGCIIKLLDQ